MISASIRGKETITMLLATAVCVFLTVSVATAGRCDRESVVFTAVIKNAANIGGAQVIVYPDVLTNEGNGYNSNTGVFTAPKAGFYMISFSALSAQNQDFWIDLYKNNDYIISAFGRQKNDFASGGNTVTLKLATGDRIYIKSRRAVFFYAKPDDLYASFSGFLIGN